jgi:Plavaka transposase
MYATIDAIQEGDAPRKTITFKYNGPRPANPPKWMLETYELCTRDSRHLLHLQLASAAFKDQVDYVPHRQFKASGGRIWSNLMSGDWAWVQAVVLFALITMKLLRISV